jgi:KUP system potassium uptake protein
VNAGTAALQVGDAASSAPKSRLPALTLAAIGIVYGDIGTSPLYTMREAFGERGDLPLGEATVLRVLSLITWSLITVVTLKYVVVMLSADNRGEGGILALTALAHRAVAPRHRGTVVVLAMVGAALFYGDGLITPAISVLSAIEGLKVATPLFKPYVVPIALAILIVLFAIQSRGTGKIGTLFGPIMGLWFTVLGLLELAQVIKAPHVLLALDPTYGLAMFTHHGWAAFITLGAVFLAVTGAEALYADMGHFGRSPIRIVWFGLVLPALLLNYFGQGALLLENPATLANPFYLLAPAWALYPMVVLATWATVIASQAVISGAFAISAQAVQLGYLPRLNVRHTSATRSVRFTSPGSTGCCSPAWSCWCSGFIPRATSLRPMASRSAPPWRSTPCSPGSSRSASGAGRSRWWLPCSPRSSPSTSPFYRPIRSRSWPAAGFRSCSPPRRSA